MLPEDDPVSLAFSVEDSSPQMRHRKATCNYNVGLSELRGGCDISGLLLLASLSRQYFFSFNF